MSLTPSSFQQAEYVDAPVVEAQMAPPLHPDPALFTRAILFGLGGVLAGAVLDAVFIGVTHINLGYLALFVAYLVAKAMSAGSRGEGGRNYQIAAIVLTYLSVALAHSALLWWDLRGDGGVPLNLHNIFALLKYGLIYPYYSVTASGISGIIGLIILFVALRAAWRMMSGIPGAVRHPFSR
jgi:hypothetical protein